MDNATTGDPRATAVEQLEQFGLSAYAAETFVALASLGTGTARDVSQVSEVPRTRVYDAIEELHERGLVDILQASPKEFWAISAETASRTFEHELQSAANKLLSNGVRQPGARVIYSYNHRVIIHCGCYMDLRRRGFGMLESVFENVPEHRVE